MYWFQQSALQDFGEAQYYIGFYKLEGRGGPQDVEQAWEWFLRGAENGVPAAMHMTAQFLAEGIFCERDEDAAFKWFMTAARAGYEESINVIALCYENGVYVAKNPQIAQKWRGGFTIEEYIEERTEEPKPLSNDGEELYQTARRCLSNQDYEGAAMFYKRAAEMGHARAQCSYGKCLYIGSGVAKNPAGAFAWFAKAAEQNLDIAQYNLGIMYLKGVYVEKNLDEARRFFTLAMENGHPEAGKILSRLK